jgi:hypothetical protein
LLFGVFTLWILGTEHPVEWNQAASRMFNIRFDGSWSVLDNQLE